jgi:hypothetical protein
MLEVRSRALSQQEMNTSADLQRDKVNISDFM